MPAVPESHKLSSQGFMVRQISMGVVLMVASASSSALSVGAIQGRAIIGRSLELRVPVHLASDDSVANLCASARVHYGDLPISGATVSVSVEGARGVGSDGPGAFVKVAAAPAVNEPFVTVDLTVGCIAPLMRSFVVLADPVIMSNDQARHSIASPLVSTLPETKSVEPPPSRPVIPLQPKALVMVARAPKPKIPPPPSKSKSNEQVIPKLDITSRQLGARLTLDPLELVASEGRTSPVLRMSTDTVDNLADAEIPPELQAKREAARALWRALNSSPEQAATQLAKGALVDAEAAQLRSQLAAAQASEATMRGQLQDEQDSRWTQPLVLGLALAFLLTSGGLMWLWSRRQSPKKSDQAKPWWKRQTTDVGNSPLPDVGTDSKIGGQQSKTAQVDIDVDTLFPPEVFRPSEQNVSAWASSERSRLHAGSDFLPSTLLDGARSVATEELFDLQQQVEFFISLGQADQAVEVLVNHIADSHEPSPLAYLDLLKLYHELARKDDYEQLRQSFNAQFNGGAPEFDQYSQSRRGLERYEIALDRIQAEWPRRGVLEVIERALFRQDADAPVEVFDLEAYRELLLLYGIAREVIDWSEEGGVSPSPVVESDLPVRGGQNLFTDLGVVATTAAEGTMLSVKSAGAVGVEQSAPNVAFNTRPDAAVAAMSALDIDLSSDFENNSNLLDPAQNVETEAERPVLDEDAAPLTMVPPDVSNWTGAGDQGIELPVKPSAAPLSLGPTQGAQSVDFDFSDLGEVGSFTIKKSGETE